MQKDILSLNLRLQTLLCWKVLGMEQSWGSWSWARALRIYCRCGGWESSSHWVPALIPGMVLAQRHHHGRRRISHLPSLGSVSTFQFPPGNPLIVAVFHSGDHLSDSKSSGGAILFVMKVCSLSPGSDFNLASWFSQFGSTSFKKKGKCGLCSPWRAAGRAAPGAAVGEGDVRAGSGGAGPSISLEKPSKQRHQQVDF